MWCVTQIAFWPSRLGECSAKSFWHDEPPGAMKISVILCTYNRCQGLANTLETIAASHLPDCATWEVIVVDNNSRDQTREVVRDFCRRYPERFRYLFEPNQGLSHARNAGIKEARGDIIAFTDDDVTVDPTWLQNLTAPLQDSQWAGAGGRIRPGHDFLPPHWMAINGPFSLAASLVQFDLGDRECELSEAPFGANMSFRKIMFEKYGVFRTDLGRCGKNLIGNEDTEFGERLKAGGERLCYVPSAIVNHPVQKERLTKKYFRSYWFAHGRSMIRQAGQQLSLRKALRYFRRDLKGKLRWISSLDRRWFLSAQGRFFFELHTLHTLGEIVEGCRQQRTVRQ
jgi:glycosyltransferase involved in cell wall biosynthesis